MLQGSTESINRVFRLYPEIFRKRILIRLSLDAQESVKAGL